MKRKVLSEEKGSILAILAEGYSEHWLPSILKILKTAFIRTRSSRGHWGQQSYRLSMAENDSLLTGMTANSFKCHSATIGWYQVTYKKHGKRQQGWSALRGWCERIARLTVVKNHKDWTIEDWRKVIFSDESNLQLCPTLGHLMVRQRPGEDYKPQYLATTVKSGWSGGASARLESDRFVFVKDSRIKAILQENLRPSALTIFPNLKDWFFQQDNQDVDGGPPDHDPVMARRISRPEPHWKPLKCDQEEDGWSQAIKLHARSGIKSSNSSVKDWCRACCDSKSGLFHQILISELFLS